MRGLCQSVACSNHAGGIFIYLIIVITDFEPPGKGAIVSRLRVCPCGVQANHAGGILIPVLARSPECAASPWDLASDLTEGLLQIMNKGRLPRFARDDGFDRAGVQIPSTSLRAQAEHGI